MFFVAGITGQVGGATARYLLKEGQHVRTLSRHPEKAAEWAKQGVEVLEGDLDNQASVAKALKGVKGAFFLIPPLLAPSAGFPEARKTIESYRQALAAALPPRVVFLSSFGSEKTSGLGNITATHLLELAMKDLPCPVAFVRPGAFMENYKGGLQQAAITAIFDNFLTPTSLKVPMTATADIGDEVGKLLVSEWTGRRIVEIGSLYSADDLAAAFAKVLGKPVQARAIPRDQWGSALEKFGAPAGQTGPYEEMMDGINSGWINFNAPGTESAHADTTPAEVFAAVVKAGQ